MRRGRLRSTLASSTTTGSRVWIARTTARTRAARLNRRNRGSSVGERPHAFAGTRTSSAGSIRKRTPRRRPSSWAVVCTTVSRSPSSSWRAATASTSFSRAAEVSASSRWEAKRRAFSAASPACWLIPSTSRSSSGENRRRRSRQTARNPPTGAPFTIMGTKSSERNGWRS